MTAARAPVVLIRTPYGRRSANVLVSRLIAERGYQVLIQSLRGTGGIRRDLQRICDEPRRRPGDHRVDAGPGLVPRRVRHVGRQLPRLRPMGPWPPSRYPEWKAAIIDVGPSDFYHTFMYPGGVFALGNPLMGPTGEQHVLAGSHSIRTRNHFRPHS